MYMDQYDNNYGDTYKIHTTKEMPKNFVHVPVIIQRMPPGRFERPTPGLGNLYSIQLSYGGKIPYKGDPNNCGDTYKIHTTKEMPKNFVHVPAIICYFSIAPPNLF
jgi:hypothetical protein